MSRYFCHDRPEILSLETRVVDARPGAVVLERSLFHPGGGGQLPDRGRLAWESGEARIAAFEIDDDGRVWHLLGEPVAVAGVVEVAVDPAFRALQTELHTNAHVLNALVFEQFHGALITGAKLNDDGTARTDFDLPDVDNDRLRALEPQLNDVIRQDLPLRFEYLPADAVTRAPGLIRCRSVAPPPAPDGSVRRRNRWPRPPGLRRHAPRIHRPLPPRSHPQDRQQGPPQPPRVDRSRRLTRAGAGRPLRGDCVRRSVYRIGEGGDRARPYRCATQSLGAAHSMGRQTMHSTRRAFSLAIIVVVVSVGADVAQLSAQDKDPRVGTWKLNVAKSKFDPGPPPQSQTLKIEPAGKGEKVTSESVTGDGKKVTTTYTANFDGKDYPISGSALGADKVSLKRIDARTTERTDKKDGKVVVTIKRVVSADGKTMTATVTGTNAEGKPVNNVAVFEKQ